MGKFIQNYFKILKFIRIWNPIMVDRLQNPSVYVPGYPNLTGKKTTTTTTKKKIQIMQNKCIQFCLRLGRFHGKVDMRARKKNLCN